MNALEEVVSAITKQGRTVKLGVMTNETADPLITVKTVGNVSGAMQLGGGTSADYRMIDVSVYSADYLAGMELICQLKAELVAGGCNLVSYTDKGSAFDKDRERYVFTYEFKQIII